LSQKGNLAIQEMPEPIPTENKVQFVSAGYGQTTKPGAVKTQEFKTPIEPHQGNLVLRAKSMTKSSAGIL